MTEFTLRNYVKTGLLLAIGKKSDYEIILKSADWLRSGVLLETDLEDIQNALQHYNQEIIPEPIF